MRLLPELYEWQGSRIVTRYYAKLRDAESALLAADRPEELEVALAACETLAREGAVLAQTLLFAAGATSGDCIWPWSSTRRASAFAVWRRHPDNRIRTDGNVLRVGR